MIHFHHIIFQAVTTSFLYKHLLQIFTIIIKLLGMCYVQHVQLLLAMDEIIYRLLFQMK
jgi:hypothetical protein